MIRARGPGERGAVGVAPGRSSGRAAVADTSLLELSRNRVTEGVEEEVLGYQLSRCRCDCWFCEDCCNVKGYNLRAELVPILETFTALLMVTFTVDPGLFESPREAFDYLRKRRCLGRTVQDLRRGGYLRSGRYFYVLEWQARTEQVHFHVLFDASFIPFDVLLASWSKHRPPNAGPVIEERPAFGTVWFSKREFEGGALHAARYATKYLVKVPSGGFPEWVMGMGKDCRVRRYGTSRGFWGREAPERAEPESHRDCEPKSYAERVGECAKTINVCQVVAVMDTVTGEAMFRYVWVGELDVPASAVVELPVDEVGGWMKPLQGVFSEEDVVRAVARAVNREVGWVRHRGEPGRRGRRAA